MIKAHGYKKIVAIADTLSIHTETLIKLQEMSATEGFTITVLPDTFGLVLPDPQAIINKIKAAYDSEQPDAIFTLSNPLAQPAIYQGLRAVGITVPIHGSPAAAHPSIMSKGPEAVEGLYVMDSGGLLNPQASAGFLAGQGLPGRLLPALLRQLRLRARLLCGCRVPTTSSSCRRP